MADKDPNPNLDAPKAPVTVVPPPAPGAQIEQEVNLLGRRVQARGEDVVSLTVERTIDSGQVVDALVQESFERICTLSTTAVARWMAGDGLEVTNDAADARPGTSSASWRPTGGPR
jgi:hypothetical protein